MNDEEKKKLIADKVQEVKDRQKMREAMDALFEKITDSEDKEERIKAVSEADPEVVLRVMMKAFNFAEQFLEVAHRMDGILKDGLSVELKSIRDPEHGVGVELALIIPQNEERPTVRSCCYQHLIEEFVSTCTVVKADPEGMRELLNGLAAAGKGTIH